MAARGCGVQARGGRIAMADREQAVGDRVPPAGMTAFAARFANSLRQSPERAKQAPREHRRDDRNQKSNRKLQQSDMRPPAVPREQDFARLIGQPGRAPRRERDQEQEENDPVHRLGYGTGRASAAMASLTN